MNNFFENTYLQDIMHDIAQGMLIPTMICLIVLILVSIFFIGQIIFEYITERRHYKQNMSSIINEINDSKYDEIVDVVNKSKLLRFQKASLITVGRNMGLEEEPLFALAQIQINNSEKHYKSRLAWTDTISKIAPLLGLMGTLIPLGPGIVALGQNDISTLSNSLLLAFDATVCGLICAILSLIISKIRNGWYTEYIDTLESLMSCIIDKANNARNEGVKLESNYTDDVMNEFFRTDKKKREGEN